ncbi:MAG: hypothetical protein HQ555_11400 [Candidatus Aminicenantes bacterium]|nr:hypothetical protein [Candidatus Aminicenantes bacterium]
MRNKGILDSWKAISDYLDRDIRTCERWEKELGLPINRINQDSPRSKVFAYQSEIDSWLRKRTNHSELQKKYFLKRPWVIAGFVSVLALLSAILILSHFINRKLTQSSPSNFSIAVLPLESINFPEYEAYIPNGLRNEISSSLARQDKIKVIPSVSITGYNESYQNLKQLGNNLGVDYILRGRIEKDNNKILLYAQLIRVKDDKNIFDEKFEERVENVSSIHKSICSKIYNKLNINKNMELLFSSNNEGSTNDTAFDYYLKGNHVLGRLKEQNDDPWTLYYQGKYYQGKVTQESNEFAINLFSKAIEIDENFAQAYIGLARCYANYLNFNWIHDKQWLDKAEEFLKKAQTIFPDSPEYYSTSIQINLIKYIGFNDNTKKIAFNLAQEAINKYPYHEELFAIVGYCYYLKFGEDGNKADFDKALELNEASYFLRPYHINNIFYAELLMLHKEYDKAILVCDDIIKRNDSSLMADYRKAESYYYMGDLDKSESLFSQFESSLEFKISSLFYLGMIASQKGEIDEVKRIIQNINIISPKEFKYFEDQLKFASIYMGIGKEEFGYECLEIFFSKEIINKYRHVYHKYIDIDKNFDNFKEEDKFINIINGREEGNSNEQHN